MKIVVLIKQVPDMDSVRFDTEKGVVDRSSAGVQINPFDLHALEAAVCIAEKTEAQIIALSMGPPRGEDALKEAIARGAQEGVLLTDAAFGGADTKATAKTLSAAIQKIGQVSLVLCGEKTVDGDTGQVGAEVAQYLGIPHVSYAEAIEAVHQDRISLRTNILEASYLVTADYPVLVTATKDLGTPRLPSIKGKLSARKAVITKWSLQDLAGLLDAEEAGLKGSPTKVKKIVVPPLSGRNCKKSGEDIERFLESMVDELIQQRILEIH